MELRCPKDNKLLSKSDIREGYTEILCKTCKNKWAFEFRAKIRVETDIRVRLVKE
jgi:phage FluMu protein Com